MNSSPNAEGSGLEDRPSILHSSRSFSRLEPSRSNLLSRHRASTLQSGTSVEILGREEKAPEVVCDGARLHQDDVFEQKTQEDEITMPKASDVASDILSQGFPEGFDELPIELVSLTDR